MALLPSSGHLPPAPARPGPRRLGGRAILATAPPRPKAGGKKANRQVLEDFPRHDPRIRKAKQILHIKTTTLWCNIKDYLLKRLWIFRWEVFPYTDAPSSDSRSLQPAVRGVLSHCCCSQKRSFSSESGGFPVPLCWAAGPCVLAAAAPTRHAWGSRGTVTSKSLPLFTERGPRGDRKSIHKSYPMPLSQCGITRLFPPAPPAPLLRVTLGKPGGIRD